MYQKTFRLKIKYLDINALHGVCEIGHKMHDNLEMVKGQRGRVKEERLRRKGQTGRIKALSYWPPAHAGSFAGFEKGGL